MLSFYKVYIFMKCVVLNGTIFIGYVFQLHVSDPNIEAVRISLETDVETPTGTGMRLLQQMTQNLTDSWVSDTVILPFCLRER